MVKNRSQTARYYVAKLYRGKELFMGYGWTEEHARTEALKRARKAKGKKMDLQSFDRVEVGLHTGPTPRGLGVPPTREKCGGGARGHR